MRISPRQHTHPYDSEPHRGTKATALSTETRLTSDRIWSRESPTLSFLVECANIIVYRRFLHHSTRAGRRLPLSRHFDLFLPRAEFKDQTAISPRKSRFQVNVVSHTYLGDLVPPEVQTDFSSPIGNDGEGMRFPFRPPVFPLLHDSADDLQVAHPGFDLAYAHFQPKLPWHVAIDAVLLYIEDEHDHLA